MLTKKMVVSLIKAGRGSRCLDARDYIRLAAFFDKEELKTVGMELKKGTTWKPRAAWTKRSILAKLKKDVDFGFEKALGKRGISSDLMYEVVKMWMWILEDELADFEEYAQYGLPFFKAVAIKYGLDNPIGADKGDEKKYESD